MCLHTSPCTPTPSPSQQGQPLVPASSHQPCRTSPNFSTASHQPKMSKYAIRDSVTRLQQYDTVQTPHISCHSHSSQHQQRCIIQLMISTLRLTVLIITRFALRIGPHHALPSPLAPLLARLAIVVTPLAAARAAKSAMNWSRSKGASSTSCPTAAGCEGPASVEPPSAGSRGRFSTSWRHLRRMLALSPDKGFAPDVCCPSSVMPALKLVKPSSRKACGVHHVTKCMAADLCAHTPSQTQCVREHRVCCMGSATKCEVGFVPVRSTTLTFSRSAHSPGS